MGLFSSSKTTTDVTTTNTSNVTVNPLNQIDIVVDNSATAGAISKGVAVLDSAVNTIATSLSTALSNSSASLGSGVSGAGVNLAFGLLAGASIFALARGSK